MNVSVLLLFHYECRKLERASLREAQGYARQRAVARAEALGSVQVADMMLSQERRNLTCSYIVRLLVNSPAFFTNMF